MHLIDKEDGAAFFDFLDDLLQALLKLAAIHRAGHQGSNVQHQQPFVEERLRSVAVDDALRKPLDDRRFADARLTDQCRVILGATGQDLNHPLDFLLAPDDGIEFAFYGLLSQVQAKLVDERGLAFLLFLFLGLFGLQEAAGRRRAHLIQAHAQAAQHVDRDAFALAHQAEQEMLGTDILMAHQTSLFDR